MQELHPLDEHNRKLLSEAHPPGWTNPEPASRYNLVVIGAGAGGLVSSIGAAMLGAKVALVEKNLLGGDCLNVGCVPSKALIRSARAYADARDAGAFGVRTEGPISVDFPAVMERMRRLRAQISPNDGVSRLRREGVDVFLGEGRFTGADTIEVGGRTLRFHRAIIATGSRPATTSISGLAEIEYLTNETIFNLTSLPRRLAVIGAGPIGCELSQAFARFGAVVHLLENGHDILAREDPDAVNLVRQALQRDGVQIDRGCTIAAVRSEEGEKVLSLQRSGEKAGDRQELRVDEILVSTGRQPNVENLGLEAAGVAFDMREGVTVDDWLRTTNHNVYAVGDVCFDYKFTHASDATARIALQNALFYGRQRASDLIMPWCTYTDPEVAHVGLYERDAKEKGVEIDTIRVDLADVDRAIVDGEEEGFVKIHVKKGTDQILGATLVARHAGEMISQVTFAMVSGAGLKKISKTIYPYPTQAEVIRKAADEYSLGRFTPLVKKLTGRLMRWRR